MSQQQRYLRWVMITHFQNKACVKSYLSAVLKVLSEHSLDPTLKDVYFQERIPFLTFILKKNFVSLFYFSVNQPGNTKL